MPATTDPDEPHAPDTPVRDRAREQLAACHSLIRQLFDAHFHLLNTNPSATLNKTMDVDYDPPDKLRPVQIMHNLITQQNTLKQLIDQVVEHQKLNHIIEQLRSANAVEDMKLSNLSSNLRSAEAQLQNALDDAKPRLSAMRRANKRPVDVDDLIAYGSKISASLSAPPGWGDTATPLGIHLPPAPTEAMMRSGRLAELTLKDDDLLSN